MTRIEEEHLWESKQLGAHSPYVLLSTLMFFNTKHFNLTVSFHISCYCSSGTLKAPRFCYPEYKLFQTVEEHMQLSFTHIMKHWKRNPNATGGPKAPGSRNVLLRFYPPQSALGILKIFYQSKLSKHPFSKCSTLFCFVSSSCKF